MFDAKIEFEKLRAQTTALKQRTYAQRKSRLDKYTGEIVQLLKCGAKPAEIHRFLKQQHRVKVHLTTVIRYIERINAKL